MYSYELKRVRYLLQSYHRTRLNKIEKFILHILEKEEVLNRLSEKEKAYAQVTIIMLFCSCRLNYLKNPVVDCVAVNQCKQIYTRLYTLIRPVGCASFVASQDAETWITALGRLCASSNQSLTHRACGV